MITFFSAGIIVTLLSISLFGYGWIIGQEFLFGPFIASLIGLNFLFITYIQYKQMKEDGSL
jgi:amino acid permease